MDYNTHHPCGVFFFNKIQHKLGVIVWSWLHFYLKILPNIKCFHVTFQGCNGEIELRKRRARDTQSQHFISLQGKIGNSRKRLKG